MDSTDINVWLLRLDDTGELKLTPYLKKLREMRKRENDKEKRGKEK